MALFDDRRFLLSHINHSFITGDDTGICEVVMLDEDVFENQHQRCLKLEGQVDDNPEERLDPEAYDLNYESELFESEQGQSYDIASDLDYICHRRRSNTAQRLDRLKKDKINQSRTKTIVWRCNSPTGSQCDEKSSKDASSSNIETPETNPNDNEAIAPNRRPKIPPRKSGLTRLLEKYPSLPKNPFDEFAQFDGGMSETVPVKKIMIYIAINNQQQHVQQQPEQNSNGSEPIKTKTDTEDNDRSPCLIKSEDEKAPVESSSLNHPQSKQKNNGPLEVVVVSTAKVQDLIGLICWQYTNEGREPKLNSDINKYCLRIVEDNGEVDPDFTSLNPRELLSKFNFPTLALTEKTEEKTPGYKEQHANGNIYYHQIPSITKNVMTSNTRITNSTGRFAALARIIFKDAKLETS